MAAYCRVSTQAEEQTESFETQRAYYEAYIRCNPNWQLVEIYSDRRSATSAEHRPGFQQMMADAREKKIDVLLVKSISRFARNVVDCQHYLEQLERCGCCVIFEKENIRSDDPTSSFILSLLSAVAQDESHSISKNVQMGYESRYKRGEYNLGSNRLLGYDTRNGELVPNQDAWIIREVFRCFLQGQTYREIADALAKMGAQSIHGKKRLSIATIRYILGNETYVGDKLLQKQAPRDYLTKKPDPNREYQQYYLRDDHEAIIDRETWDAVRRVWKRREEDARNDIYRGNQKHHVFYGRVFCGICGAPYTRRTYCGGKQNYKAWNCRKRQKGGRENGCVGPTFSEEKLTYKVLNQLGWLALDEARFEREVQRVLIYPYRIEIECQRTPLENGIADQVTSV